MLTFDPNREVQAADDRGTEKWAPLGAVRDCDFPDALPLASAPRAASISLLANPDKCLFCTFARWSKVIGFAAPCACNPGRSTIPAMTKPARPIKRLRISTSPWTIAQPYQTQEEQRKSDVRSVVGGSLQRGLGPCCRHELVEPAT